MKRDKKYTRREFIEKSFKVAAGAALVAPLAFASHAGSSPFIDDSTDKTAAVSVAKIKDGNVGYAVEKAVDLLGGINTVTAGKQSIMLKPNLVSGYEPATTKRHVIKTLAGLMQGAGKQVFIGEGSAAAQGYNHLGGEDYRTWKQEILDPMQQHVFDTLGYTELGEAMNIPLVNLHSGEMATVPLPDGFAFKELIINKSLTEIDMLCSVPMMKTHGLAQVTLGMKNLMGVYPGTVYGSVRGHVHDVASAIEPSGTAVAVVDMVRVNKLGLVVVDGSTAMEGEGPSMGDLVDMNVIIAGTNPLATDMVAAYLMGFKPQEVPTFTWANRAGMLPEDLSQIEIRGEDPEKVKRNFKRPTVNDWKAISPYWGYKQISGRRQWNKKDFINV